MTLQPIRYNADGFALKGYLAKPEGNGKWPGILVAHEAPGMNDHIKQWTLDLSRLGYVVLAIDLYGKEGLSIESARALNDELMSTPGLLFRRADAGLQMLMAHPQVDTNRIASVGFCQGAITALELARGGGALRSIVGIHPGLIRPKGSIHGKINSRLLMIIGDQDPVSPPEVRKKFEEEMKVAEVDLEIILLTGVGHSFSNPHIDDFCIAGFAYNEDARNRAWQAMCAFLGETLH